MNKLGQFIKRKREELQLTQEDIGRQLGLSGQYVSNVERGVHKNPVTFCVRFFRVLPAKDQSTLEELLAEAIKEKIEEKRQSILNLRGRKLGRSK